MVEGDHADIVKCKALKDVLKVDGFVGFAGYLEQWEEAVLDLLLYSLHDKISERPLAEFKACCLPLHLCRKI